jgi:hypothetical protein
VVAPATLTVQLVEQARWKFSNISNVDFNSLNFASVLSDAPSTCNFDYVGPQFEISRIVGSAVRQGAILPYAAPGAQPNVTYESQLIGPGLRCADVAEPLRSQILSNITGQEKGFLKFYGYLAWTPSDQSAMPFRDSRNGDGHDQLGPWTTATEASSGLSIYVATFPNMATARTSWKYGPGSGGSPTSHNNSTILECQLVNATYDYFSTWRNGILTPSVTTKLSNDNIPFRGSVECDHYLFSSGVDNPGSSQTDALPLSMYNNTIIRNFAYQAVMQAFGRVLVGSISNSNVKHLLDIAETDVMSTPLGQVHELARLRNWTNEGPRSLSSLTSNNNRSYWPGVSVRPDSETVRTTDLRSTLELMFQNATLSLLSSSLLQWVNHPYDTASSTRLTNLLRFDPSTPYPQSPVNVTVVTFQNKYAYSALTLWLAYGVALIFAGVIATLGCIAIFSDDISYEQSFSTILRTTSHAKISTTISSADALGQNPLPERLAKATITFGGRTEEEYVEMLRK